MNNFDSYKSFVKEKLYKKFCIGEIGIISMRLNNCLNFIGLHCIVRFTVMGSVLWTWDYTANWGCRLS